MAERRGGGLWGGEGGWSVCAHPPPLPPPANPPLSPLSPVLAQYDNERVSPALRPPTAGPPPPPRNQRGKKKIINNNYRPPPPPPPAKTLNKQK